MALYEEKKYNVFQREQVRRMVGEDPKQLFQDALYKATSTSIVKWEKFWEKTTFHDHVGYFIEFATQTFAETNKETAANVIKFLETLVNGNVTYKESVYKIDFIKAGYHDVVRFYSKEEPRFDMNIELFMNLVADEKIKYEKFKAEEARAVLTKNNNSDFYFNYFLEGWVYTKQVDKKCKFFGQQVREQLKNKRGLYVDLSNNQHYFASKGEVYLAFKGVPNKSQYSVKAVIHEKDFEEIKEQAVKLLGLTFENVGAFRDFDAKLTILRNIAGQPQTGNRESIINLRLQSNMDRESNITKYLFGSIDEKDARPGLRLTNKDDYILWKKCSLLYEFERYNRPPTSVTKRESLNSNWGAVAEESSTNAKKMLTKISLMSSLYTDALHTALNIFDTHLYTNYHSLDTSGVYYNMGEGKDGIERLREIAPNQVNPNELIQYYHYYPHHLISPNLTFEDYNNDNELQKSILCELVNLQKRQLKALKVFFLGEFSEQKSTRVVVRDKSKTSGIDLTRPFCLYESFLYHLLDECGKMKDDVREKAKLLVGNFVFLKNNERKIIKGFNEGKFITDDGEFEVAQYGKDFNGSSWSSNLDSYVNDDPWYLFEVAFTLERYWNDCYCIFEHITKCMIVPLLNDSEKTKVKRRCNENGFELPKSFSTKEAYDYMLKSLERLVEELLVYDEETLQIANTSRRVIPLTLEHRLEIFYLQQRDIIDEFLETTLFDKNEEAIERFNAFRSFVLYNASIRLGLTPTGFQRVRDKITKKVKPKSK